MDWSHQLAPRVLEDTHGLLAVKSSRISSQLKLLPQFGKDSAEDVPELI